jgi:hypothetical protein
MFSYAFPVAFCSRSPLPKMYPSCSFDSNELLKTEVFVDGFTSEEEFGL